MTTDAFEGRRKAFEEEYFIKKNRQLVDKLKGVFHQHVEKDAIRKATGITDERVLDNLVALDVSGELLPAFKLFPLIEVAWADGRCDKREARAVLDAAEQNGIFPGSQAYAMLENGLKNGPRPDARKAWYMFAGELRKVLDATELAEFRRDLVEYAKRVADSSGGILGMVLTESVNERKVRDAIERALTPEGD